MISRLSYIRSNVTDPYRNLALEKYLTFHAGKEECILFLWQNRRTVVIGKNQNPYTECHVHALLKDGGFLARRLSGGGAVYHDTGNLNFSFCTGKENYDPSKQTDVILLALQKAGIPAEKNGRNDITAAGRKFSGHAFLEKKEGCCHHGTLMLDVNVADLDRYLNVPKDKLLTKGIASVRSRVINLKELYPYISTDILEESLKEAFCEIYGLPVNPCPEDSFRQNEIMDDAAFFASDEWIFGRKIAFTARLKGRFDWGGLELLLDAEGGTVREILCYSDSLQDEIADMLETSLKGSRYDPKEMTERIRRIPDRSGALAGVKKDICCLIQSELQGNASSVFSIQSKSMDA